jgi:hypothetical protein
MIYDGNPPQWLIVAGIGLAIVVACAFIGSLLGWL